MTSKEAFEKWYQDGHSLWAKPQSYEIWQAALEWAASQQQPVAWYDPVSDLPNNKRTKWSTEPLYLHPAPIEPDEVMLHDMELAYEAGFRDGVARVGLPSPIPEGWKLVPIEPTEEMLDAQQSVKQYDIRTPRWIWEAMLAAAPE